VIATLGRLTGVKGQADLVRAFATLTASGGPTRLLLIGDGEELQPLQRLCAELGVAERVVFSGWREDVGDVLRAVDLFVLPSLNEGMGKALVEAMYIGLPLVATRVGGVPDLVVDGRHGLLVPPGQPEALGQALTRLWKDAALRDRLGEQACQRAARFGSEAMVQKLCRLYRSLSGGQPPDPRDDGHQPVEENAVACP
jgi:glycosyltransferase involved in cell wall biosynthesis